MKKRRYIKKRKLSGLFAGLLTVSMLMQAFSTQALAVGAGDSEKTVEDIVVDNAHGNFHTTTVRDSWGTSTSRPGYYGGNYRSISGENNKGATANWLPEVKESGYYNIYINLPDAQDETTISDSAPYTVIHGAGAETLRISQRTPGGWTYLGTAPFSAGRTAKVTLTADADVKGQALMADAVKLEYQEPWNGEGLIIDNTEAVYEGKGWTDSSYRKGYYGKGYRSVSNDAENTHTVTWTAGDQEAGSYMVYVWHADGNGDSSITARAPYDITAGGETHRVYLNQRTQGAGGQWRPLTACRLDEPGDISVTLSQAGVETRTAVMADAVKIERTSAEPEAAEFTDLSADFYTSVGGGYRVLVRRPDGEEPVNQDVTITIDGQDFSVNPKSLEEGDNPVGICSLEPMKQHRISLQGGEGAEALAGNIRLEYIGYDLYYSDLNDGFEKYWTVSGGMEMAGGSLSGSGGMAVLSGAEAWKNICMDVFFTAGEGEFGWILSGIGTGSEMKLSHTGDGYLELTQAGETLAKSSEKVELSEGEHLLQVDTSSPDITVSLDGKQLLKAEGERRGGIGIYTGGAALSVTRMGVRSAKEPEQGTYTIDQEDPRQTIWGLGIEIQSDSIASGNQGLPEETNSVPHDLTQPERDRLYSEMLSGFRFMRMAGGLYYRGTDEEGKHLQERWDTQNEELAELLEKSGIEGIDFEFWSPTPYFKASGEYRESNDSNKQGLKCFSKSWEHYGNEEKTRQFLQEFADTIVEDLKYLRENDLPVIQFTIQNEPKWQHDTGYSHCFYTNEAYYETAKVVWPTLKQAFPDMHIHADSMDGQYGKGADLIKADEELLSLLDAWTHHRIGENSDKQITQQEHLTSNKGRDDIAVYNTEFEYLDEYTSDERCINTAQSIMNWMTFEESPVWHWLHALKPLGNSEAEGYSLGFWRKPGDTSQHSEKYNHIKEGEWDYNYQNWNSIRGFLKYMPWDSVRYTVNEDEVRFDQRIMTWKTPEGKQVIALTNRSRTPFRFNINTGLEENTSFRGYRYTPNGKEEMDLGTLTGTQIDPSLPGLSIEFWVQEDTEGTMIMADGVDLDRSLMQIETGKSGQLSAAVTPENAANKSVRWTSSDSAVARVDENGTVTGLKAGTAVITATAVSGSGRYSADCQVTVTNSPEPEPVYQVKVNEDIQNGRITVNPTEAREGETVTLRAEPDEGFWLTKENLSVTVEGTDQKVELTEEENQTYTFRMPAGHVTVTAKFQSGMTLEEALKLAREAAEEARKAQEEAMEARDWMEDMQEQANKDLETAKLLKEEAEKRLEEAGKLQEEAGADSEAAKTAMEEAVRKAEEARQAGEKAEESQRAAETAQAETKRLTALAEAAGKAAKELAKLAGEKAAWAEEAARQAEEERAAAQKAREEAEARQLEAEQIKKQIEKEQAALQEALRKSQAIWAEAEKTEKQNREELEKLKRDLEKAAAQADKQEEKTKITRPGRVRLKSVKCPKKGQLTVTWKKVKEADGYRIQYSQNPEFKRAVTKKAGEGKTKLRLKNPAAGKTCYIRIRAVKKTERGNVYGAYSKVKKVKVR